MAQFNTPWGNMYGAALGYVAAPAPAPAPAPPQGQTRLKKFIKQDEGDVSETEDERRGLSYGMRGAAREARALALLNHPVTQVLSLPFPGVPASRAAATALVTHSVLDKMGKDYTIGEMAYDNLIPFVGGNPEDRVLDRWSEVFRTIPNAPGALDAGTQGDVWDLTPAIEKYMDQPHLRPGPQDVSAPGFSTDLTPPAAQTPDLGMDAWSWGGGGWF